MGETKGHDASLEELEKEGIPAEEADAAMEAEFEDPVLDEALGDFKKNLGTPSEDESRDDMPREDKRGKPRQ